ncbi:glycine-rich domain-containing protein [Anabaena lutea]|uniref:Uncharacterized protein n=1 Tax=Anabaena lutea FACHB-196 TaxID=2692881 RepID=A0ABR8FGF8_9NOST|nr:hypothetical protein [Anabaena lutea]MBD2567791.1 hypothetical protein [Anabaena lutea FACHB-196]
MKSTLETLPSGLGGTIRSASTPSVLGLNNPSVKTAIDNSGEDDDDPIVPPNIRSNVSCRAILPEIDAQVIHNEAIADYIMSAQSQELDMIQKLRLLDLQPTAFLLTHPKKAIRWTQEKTVQAIAHYKMFLLLHYLYPDQNIVPTEEIDLVWEHHFADNAKYRQDCQMLFGHFLDHNPYFGILDEADEKNWLAAFAETKLLFEKHFGRDFLAAVNLEFTNPARCELPKKQKQIHPLNIQADVIDILPWHLLKCG